MYCFGGGRHCTFKVDPKKDDPHLLGCLFTKPLLLSVQFYEKVYYCSHSRETIELSALLIKPSNVFNIQVTESIIEVLFFWLINLANCPDDSMGFVVLVISYPDF